jgi:sterol 3beta-glucosyltransferase
MPPSSPSVAAAACLDGRAARRVSRKLQKKRRDGEHTPTLELPERLRDHGDQADGEEEVLQPRGFGGGLFMNMNQSIFGLIAAAGSHADFTGRFEAHSSDEDDDDDADNHMARTIAGPRGLGPASSTDHALARTTVLPRHGTSRLKSESRHRKKLSESRILRSMSGLARLTDKIKSSKAAKTMPHEDDAQEPGPADAASALPASDLAPSIEITRTDTRTAPVMSRMLEARAQMEARPSFDLDNLDRMMDGPSRNAADAGETGPTELAKKLKEIFEFDKPEEVIEEYPCWLLQHVLLQGYMYITARHIAFYAYLPKKAVRCLPPVAADPRSCCVILTRPQHELIKSGYLAKCGKRNPKYNRYWFRLKGDVLSYYTDPQDLYFPQGQIDLRYGISATINEKDKEGVNFTVSADNRTYHLRADSPQSAKEWVKALQRVIFRSHNDGDSVKISLPIENVIDIEETRMLNFAETCKIRVIDNDETYAIDEVWMTLAPRTPSGGIAADLARSISSPSSALERRPSTSSRS